MTDIAELVKKADDESRNNGLHHSHTTLFAQLAQALRAQTTELEDLSRRLSDSCCGTRTEATEVERLRLDVARLETQLAEALDMRANIDRLRKPSVEPRFFIDHGAVHDRVTGKHVSTKPDDGYEDGVTACCELLNALSAAGSDVARLEREVAPLRKLYKAISRARDYNSRPGVNFTPSIRASLEAVDAALAKLVGG